MRILITGTTGYIAKRLALQLLEDNHELICCVRDLNRIPDEIEDHPQCSFVKIDFLDPEPNKIPKDIDAAYYLIHSMSTGSDDFESLERQCALNFKNLVDATNCKQVLYLSGIVNDESLSKHLESRLKVEETLKSDHYALTTLRAGIIVGSGSASFEIIRDIVEKLPIMITPRWLNTKTQPLAIRDVLGYLSGALGKEELYNTLRQAMNVQEDLDDFQDASYTLYEIAPKLDPQALREHYFEGHIFKIGDLVENVNTGICGKVVSRGSNYVIFVDESERIYRSWLKDLQEINKLKEHLFTN